MEKGGLSYAKNAENLTFSRMGVCFLMILSYIHPLYSVLIEFFAP